MAALNYLAAVRDVLRHLEQTQLPAIGRAADLMVHALQHQGVVYCGEIGHGIQGDFIHRAGGLAAVRPFTWSFTVNDPVPRAWKDRPAPEVVDRELEAVRFAVRSGNLRAGDVLVLGSVSGKNRAPVELALACRARGVKTVGLTALAYTQQVASLHPSGKRLFEVVDVVIDNGAPYGDAVVKVPGVDVDVLPVSGVSMIVGGWCIFGRVMEKMAAAGNPPSVFMSLNREEGPAYYDASKKRYQERGY
jgi:uncharacterized phosphosugar-binding protein